MPDPFLTAAQRTFALAFEEMNACLDGLSVEQLNWRPEGPDLNSVAALAVHSLNSARSWLAIAMGTELPQRDRDAEFRTVATSPQDLTGFVSRVQGQCLDLVAQNPHSPWSALRSTHARPDPDSPGEETGAWALMHALEHLREHLGQMWLTRQLALSACKDL